MKNNKNNGIRSIRPIATALIIGFFLFNGPKGHSQGLVRKYLNSVLNDTSDAEKAQFIFYPTLAYAPETSWEVGISSLLVYYAKGDTLNRLSEISGFTFFTLERQYGLWFDHALYSDRDKWFFLGRLRFQSFPLLYHGIGMDSPEEYIARVDANQILFRERILRNITKDYFIGLEIDYQRLSSVDFNYREPALNENDLILGEEGVNSFGIGLGLVHDNRHNVLNVREGFFAELALLHYNESLGSTYQFTSFQSDVRLFRKHKRNNVIAAQFVGQYNTGDVPFHQLALMGGESMMRGYYLGRYRDNGQIATQLEYRFLPIPFSFTDRIGASVFASAGSVFSDLQSFAIGDMVAAGGFGLRFLLFPNKDIYTRLDVAFTAEGTGFYLFIGEAF